MCVRVCDRVATTAVAGYYFQCAAQAAVARRNAAVDAGLLGHPLGSAPAPAFVPPVDVHATVLPSEFLGALPSVVLMDTINGNPQRTSSVQHDVLMAHLPGIESKVGAVYRCFCRWRWFARAVKHIGA